MARLVVPIRGSGIQKMGFLGLISSFQFTDRRKSGLQHLLSGVRQRKARLTCLVATQPAPNIEESKMDTPKEIFLKDYKMPDYYFDSVDLDFLLGEEKTIVSSKITVLPRIEGFSCPLTLDGPGLKLISIKVDGNLLKKEDYLLDSRHLTLPSPPTTAFTLEIVTEIYPQDNTSLEGLYKSSGNFCTQCEAEGFRRITFYQDRPDIMAKYTCRIEADKTLYPVLLSNGNLMEKGDLEGGKHYALWEDPFKKPCYLFALVAGQLESRDDTFVTRSGREVLLRIWTPAQDLPKTAHAMYSLKAAMKWDEEEFSSDMGSRPVKRIADVSKLRAYQFPQDASPMAHPVRPHSYIKVYEKGAEVVRMYKTLLGSSGFRKVLSSRNTSRESYFLVQSRFPHIFFEIQKEEEFVFSDITERPVPSLLRGYSSPVRLDSDLTDSDLYFLLAHDSDEFNRWEAGQILARKLMLTLVADFQQNKPLVLNPKFVEGIRSILCDSTLDKDFVALAVTLPGEGEIMDLMEVADPDAVHAVRSFIRKQLALQLKMEFVSTVKNNTRSEPYVFNHHNMARRALKNTALAYIAYLDEPELNQLALHEYHSATNMTEQFAALAAIAQNPGQAHDDVLADFYKKWEHNYLVVNKWFSLQAMSNIPGNIVNVQNLLNHPSFDLRNPNKVYSLIGGFCGSRVNFHAKDGSGYKFLGDMVASRLVSALSRWGRYDETRQALHKVELQKIMSANGLSENVYEIASKSLAA
ncbi:hypothetical protein QJS04_geneDACA002053 [Acorus gramineus]|uniref:Puromycin-sensitive aminopeptidase n=1 Tax=Acorus gramineus TaxID=55184 RepID=A0AAV9AA09_ACOGR|nr:hypothetical protein QJS04_geneDACA002053 [Acorus gramineus]